MSVTNSTAATPEAASKVWQRSVFIALIAFLTLIDLFGSQALLPQLVEAYGTTPAEMGVAVNASTLGMAVAGLAIALVSRMLDRKFWIWMSLALLSIPTALLGVVDDITQFTALRIIQGLFMAAAFTMTMTWLSEQCSVTAAGGALAAYITGNVASNLFGRAAAVLLAENFGLSANFFAFAVLNLVGAALAFIYIGRSSDEDTGRLHPTRMLGWMAHLANPALRASFGIGFLLLFVFIGVFTYVNFVLVRAPFNLTSAMLGVVYIVFLPSILTTPVAGRLAAKIGTRPAFWLASLLACAGLALLVLEDLRLVLFGLTLVGIGTFFAQAVATGFVGRAATTDRASANGLYLASYYFGGLIGAIVVGRVYEHLGWTATVLCMIAALLLACLLALRLNIDITKHLKS